MDNLEYANRYNEIHAVLHSAYIDLFYLIILRDYENENGEYRKDLCSPLIHICELLKRDLCLNLWKVCFDKDERANTLPHLKNLLYEFYGKNIKTKYFQSKKKEINQIETIRKTSLAHVDANRASLTIQVTSFETILHEARYYLNELCCTEISPDVNKFSNAELMHIQLDAKLRFGTILRQGAFITKEEKSEDNA